MGWLDVATEAVLKHDAQQDADELAIFLATLEGVIMPRCILEIGTAAAGLTWAMAHVSTVERIVTVDQAVTWSTANVPTNGPDVHFVSGPSKADDTKMLVKQHLGPYQPDVVVIDAAHDYASARHDFDVYGQLCAEDGVIMLHDSRGYPGRTDFGVGVLLHQLQDMRPVTEIYSRRLGPAGTALVWAGEKFHGLTYDERETWPR